MSIITTKPTHRDFNGQLVKGVVLEVDAGLINTSVTVQSGKRTITVILTAAEAFKAGLKVGCEVFCLISGKDITIISDIKEYMTKLHQKNPNMQVYMVK